MTTEEDEPSLASAEPGDTEETAGGAIESKLDDGGDTWSAAVTVKTRFEPMPGPSVTRSDESLVLVKFDARNSAPVGPKRTRCTSPIAKLDPLKRTVFCERDVQ